MQLVQSCFGPRGRLKLLHNSVGGSVTTTSASSVLLSAISSSQPLVGLIRTSVLHHVARFGDCGLFAAVLCVALIERARRSGLRARVAARLNAHLLHLCTAYLRQEDCGCRMKLAFGSSHHLVTLARSVVSSKPACALTRPERLHVSRLSVQALLLTVPCSGAGVLGRTVTVAVEGPPVEHSAVFRGLLVDTPEPRSFRPAARPLRVAVFSASLAGDLADVGDGAIEVRAGEDADSRVLDQLLELGERVVTDGVKLFVCQKVVHPVLQQYLRSHHVVVVERLGMALMEPLLQLTGPGTLQDASARIPLADVDPSPVCCDEQVLIPWPPSTRRCRQRPTEACRISASDSLDPRRCCTCFPPGSRRSAPWCSATGTPPC